LAPPTAREWARHTVFFLLTVLTTVFAGIMLAFPEGLSAEGFHVAQPHTIPGYVVFVPLVYASEIFGILRGATLHPWLIAQGVAFSASLLAILTAHESGHYLACRKYGVEATLPFFIPAPPLMLTGTFGAFIKIKSPIPSRKALFDIGVAGPIAGFVVALPILVLGLLTSHSTPAPILAPGDTAIIFHDPLLTQGVAKLLGVNLSTLNANSFYYAAWIGLLVTSLNLMPVGQLDGGHATYSVFGRLVHRWLGRIAFVAAVTLAVLGWEWHGSPSGFVYSLLLAFVLRMPHPQPNNDVTPLDGNRRVVAALTLLIFVLCFLPFPISVK
jgi:membrane-associated protease RseP (regulator of RpoE activity)